MAERAPRGVTTAKAPPRRMGRPPRTEAERAAQRLRLLTGAMDAIRAQGPELSVDDIATAIGVSKPVLYDEFGGKIGLADAIAVVLAEGVEGSVLDHIARGGTADAEGLVRLAVTSLVDLVNAEPQIYGFLLRAVRSNERGFLDNALVREMHQRAANLVQVIAPSIDRDTVRVLTDGLFGFMFAAIESWHETKRPSKAKFIAATSDIILNGLKATAAQTD